MFHKFKQIALLNTDEFNNIFIHLSKQRSMHTIQDITNHIEELCPLQYAESFDNVGLLVGDPSTKITGVLVTLDCLETIVDEAIEKKCNLIVAFHPIVFSGLKKLNGTNYVERVVIKAIKNDIAIYAMHTALDNMFDGVNGMICDRLKLTNRTILIPQKNTLKKLLVYVPVKHATALRKSLFESGAGSIGNYDNCSFNIEGKGTYRGNEDSNPTIGNIGENHSENEIGISVVFEKHKQSKIVKAMFANHPYEEVAYELSTLENNIQTIGMGMVGEFETAMSEDAFLLHLKKQFKSPCIKHSKKTGKLIKRVAVLGGAGSFAIDNAIRAGADAYVSADFKYHEFYKAENQIIIADIGHYESEQYTKNLLVEFLTKKFTNFAIILSDKITNPIYYI